MEFNTIVNLFVLPYFRYIVVCIFVLLYGIQKNLFLFFCRMYSKSQSALEFHIHILLQYLQKVKKTQSPLLPKGRSLRLQGGEDEIFEKTKDIEDPNNRMEEREKMLSNFFASLATTYEYSKTTKAPAGIPDTPNKDSDGYWGQGS